MTMVIKLQEKEGIKIARLAEFSDSLYLLRKK